MKNLIRAKRKSEFLLLELDLEKRKIKVIQSKTSHVSKMGYFEARTHLLFIEEAIYLVKIGAAAVLTSTSACPLSLSQLMATLPMFGSSVQRVSIFSCLYRNGFVVFHRNEHRNTYYELRKEPEGNRPYFLLVDSVIIPEDVARDRIIIATGSATIPRFRFLDSCQSFDPRTTFVVQ